MTWKSSDNRFSRICNIEGLGRELVRMDIDPVKSELADLRDRLNIEEVKFLHANAEVQRQSDSDLIDVRVTYKALVTQKCVVTLEPVEQEIEEEFSVSFTETENLEATPEGVEIVHTLEDDDPPDVVVDGKLDIVDLLVEYIALALEPYPRSADALSQSGDSGNINDGQNDSSENLEEDRIFPFANLKEMMEKK